VFILFAESKWILVLANQDAGRGLPNRCAYGEFWTWADLR